MDHTLNSRRLLSRFAVRFFLVHTLFTSLIFILYAKHLPYFNHIPQAGELDIVLAYIYVMAAFVAQMSIFNFLACAILCVGILCYPRRWFAIILAILLAVIVLFAQVADGIVYSMYHLHLSKVGVAVIKAGALSKVIPLSFTEKLTAFIVLSAIVAIELLIALYLWRRVNRAPKVGFGYAIGVLLVLNVSFVYGMMALALASSARLSPVVEHVILRAARIAPYLSEISRLVLPGDRLLRSVETEEGKAVYQVDQINRPLRYPLVPLQCSLPKKPLNVVIIGVDTLRYDAMNAKVMPTVYKFAQKAIQFNDHWSGGNCTGPGLFSLFYGIPANYWRAVLAREVAPVMIHQFLKAHYQMGIFTSAPLTFPPLHKTVFKEVGNLQLDLPGANTVIRDEQITRAFHAFINDRSSAKPFFVFLFYDAVHNYCEADTPHQTPFQPAVVSCDRFSLTKYSDPVPYLNRYRNAAYFVDHEIAKVIVTLKQSGLLKNTVIIITSDHGEQFNDEGSGLWEHSSAYTRYQLQVPMIVYWPGMPAKIINTFTTHFDIVPTLLQQVLGCNTPSQVYSVGQSLFDLSQKPYLIAGSYGDYAIVTKTQIMRFYPSGDYAVNDIQGRSNPEARLKYSTLKSAYKDLNRYFQSN